MPVEASKAARVHQIVPKASGVAGALHQVMPEPAHAPDTPQSPSSPGSTDPRVSVASPSALACPRTGAACPALTRLFASLAPSGEEARAWLTALAPCSHCRVSFEAGRDGLRHVRLGQREREILLAASEAAFTVTEPGMSRSLSAARRRAALSLGKAGLVTPIDASAKAAGPQRATVALTDLGWYVMTAYGRYLTAGKPVRWTRPARGVALPGRDPSDLVAETLARTEAALLKTLGELKGVLVAAIGGRLRDPARLDNVTRHLERKATLLRAVLEPARADRA